MSALFCLMSENKAECCVFYGHSSTRFDGWLDQCLLHKYCFELNLLQTKCRVAMQQILQNPRIAISFQHLQSLVCIAIKNFVVLLFKTLSNCRVVY